MKKLIKSSSLLLLLPFSLFADADLELKISKLEKTIELLQNEVIRLQNENTQLKQSYTSNTNLLPGTSKSTDALIPVQYKGQTIYVNLPSTVQNNNGGTVIRTKSNATYRQVNSKGWTNQDTPSPLKPFHAQHSKGFYETK